MLLQPLNCGELGRDLAEASRKRTRITRVDLSGINSLVEHKPEDMTATVEAGMTLARFQEQLRRAGQWLPIDPPNTQTLTVGDLLAENWSGPRRYGYGTVRDYLIGIKVAMANGEIIKAGGKVVKNVAGYDLCKLFVGAKHSLGIIVEATFKLRPLPEAEVVLESSVRTVDALNSLARTLLDSAIEPMIADVHNLRGDLALVAGFAGSHEDVAHQVALARKIAPWKETLTTYDEEFRKPTSTIHRLSVLPSETAKTLGELEGAAFVARFGNGIIYHTGEARADRVLPNANLAERLKKAYDPEHIFPEYRL
jgi:FAD/FMN-containing dehydrogenase